MKDFGILCLMILVVLFSPLLWLACKIIDFFEARKERFIVDVFYGDSVEPSKKITYRWHHRQSPPSE